MPTSDVLFTILSGHHSDIGLITLNRPAQLNVLSHAMNVAICAQLKKWAQENNIKAVIICGAGEKAFCAGGDIREIYNARDDVTIGCNFFKQEYSLNHAIYHFPKPYIALLNGLVMGGGLGVSVNGKYRIATEKLKLAMPETGIGFFTDVGASYFLTRCPGKIGWYLGLTGHVMGAADAQQLGLVDLVLNSSDIPDLITALTQAVWSDDLHNTVTQILRSFKNLSLMPTLVTHQPIIDRCFSKISIEEILAALNQENDIWSEQIYQLLQTRSPLSLKIVLEQLNRGSQLNFDDCLRMEYRLANRFLRGTEFYEGIRAAVIDKDRSPHWYPAHLSEITTDDVARYFAPLEKKDELVF